MIRWNRTLLALLLTAPATAAVAQTPGSPVPRPRQAPSGAPAQQGGSVLRGLVRDAAGGAPLAGASVAVRRSADSALVAGVVSGGDGSFRVEGLRPGTYYLRVSRLGYTTGTVSRVEVAEGRAADVGEVRLAASVVMLEGLTATAQVSSNTVTSTPDRTVVSTRDMPAVSGGAATDVLRNVPGVDVDADGKVSLRGNQNVAIQINGRPATLTGDALSSFLRQLPANLVNRVEVVPNPSARYDPDGMGGILNIVLKQDTDLGTSGGFSGGGGTNDRYNVSGNLARQSGPLTLFGSYGFNYDVRDQTGYSLRSEHFDGQPQEFLEQFSDGSETRISHTVNASADLKLGTRNVLSSTFLLNHGLEKAENGTGFSALNALRDLTGSYRSNTANRQAELNTDATLGFERTLQPRKHVLSGNLRFSRSSENTQGSFGTIPGAVAPLDLLGDSRTDLDAATRQMEAQLDYTRQVAGMQLETGYKGTLRRLDNLYVVDSLHAGIPDPTRRVTDDFRYDENVQAGYAMLSRQAGRRLSLQGGVRVERATTTFHLADSARAFPNNYTSLFPSAAATYQVSDQDQLHFSYSKRIQRPRAQQLNPFPEAEDQYNVRVGNPDLHPEYTHSYEASYQRSMEFGSVTLTPFYRHTVDAVRRYRTVDPATGISTSTFANLATSNSYGTDLNGQFRLGSRVSGMLGASFFQAVTEGGSARPGLSSDAFSWSARGNVNLKLGRGTDLQWFQSYRAPTDVPQGHVGAFSMANLALRQKINDQTALTLRVMDPFNTMRFSSETFDPEFSETSTRRFSSRALFLNVSYNFGHAPRIKRPVEQPQQPQGDPGEPQR